MPQSLWIALCLVLCASLSYAAVLPEAMKRDDTLFNNGGALDNLAESSHATLDKKAFPFASGRKMSKFDSFKNRTESLESFNRPVGTESLVVPAENTDGNLETSYGRTFGMYGSYKNHHSWKNAVANDRQNQIVIPDDLKLKFPWLANNLQKPKLHGFGVQTLWNSYAFPEGTPTVNGLGPQKLFQSPSNKIAADFPWQQRGRGGLIP